ncbi:heme o synthase [Halalkalibacterium halodurans]|uniref:heme o synthase n=1 Tax=Halalkalibacterium halodurans TaxID=86665 RepID=UPI002E223BA5|nr:heme o synthase [Halalkalibacterium halodurans]MED4079758.1 heme o synthase [Halalkalibacterium halodurans]MED4086300.1 heme o synthase [Halalkalibacterium halodurans]MED4103355.1 heme o synthase [Halalkalibacterium halodurans]MED4107948.1 heme o synthase [Halalkalibacterium halodurans]MED4125944.1 heme o synthase [Halalkalibacterium halodurans]
MNKPDTAIEAADVIEAEANASSTVVQQKSWKDYLTLAKTGIVTSNLITTFAGLFLAATYIGVSLSDYFLTIVWTMVGAALVMAGGCTLNNYIDRDIDHLMERTKDRPSVTGRFSGQHILWMGFVQSAAGIFFLLLTTPVAAVIGFIGLFVYVVLYSMWTKRTTTLNTIVGSISGAVPPLIGWSAIDGSLHSYAWLMFFIMFFWQPPHFLALAMKRVEEYRRAGIPMLPVVAGFEMTKRQMVIYVVALTIVSLMLYPFGIIYTTVAAILGVGWLALGIAGFKMKDDVKWARLMFVYSLNYLTILFVLMVVVHL